MSSDEVFGFGLFDDIPPEGQPHPLLIDDFESDEDVGVRVKNIYAATIDGTELHRAVRSGDRVKIEEILKLYQDDFDKVKECLVSWYLWNLEDHTWLNIANSKKNGYLAGDGASCSSPRQHKN